MRVIPKSQPNEEDDESPNFWYFGPSFIKREPQEEVEEEEEEEEEEEKEEEKLINPPPSRGKRKSSINAREKTKRIKKLKCEENGILKERWTKERYVRAEMKVIELMREKEGARIARKELREMARRHIGDTGLLDHLLKHMVGKVVGDRGERFVRGYNEGGVMHYWLESEELVENRRKEREEIDELRQRVGILTRELEELRALKELEKSVWKGNYERLLTTNIKLEADIAEMNNSFQDLKENYKTLLKRNIKLEAEMAGMKDEMLLREEQEKKAVEMEMIEGAKDFRQLHKHHLSMPPKDFYSSQPRQPYPKIKDKNNCGSQKSLTMYLSNILIPSLTSCPLRQIPRSQNQGMIGQSMELLRNQPNNELKHI